MAEITGFTFSSYLNLVRLDVPEDDITALLMADYGVDLYGNAVTVNITCEFEGKADIAKHFSEEHLPEGGFSLKQSNIGRGGHSRPNSVVGPSGCGKSTYETARNCSNQPSHL